MNAALGERVCDIARASVAHAARHGEPAPPPAADRPELAEHRASFVTLTLRGALRGCIGSLHASRPLAEDVHANAWAAACRDPRFPPLAVVETTAIDVHVSVLSPLQPLPFESRAELLHSLRPGRDGLLIRAGHRQATFLPSGLSASRGTPSSWARRAAACASSRPTGPTFLPSVWEQLPDPAQFLAALKRKAGIPGDCDDFEAARYHCDAWHSPAARG